MIHFIYFHSYNNMSYVYNCWTVRHQVTRPSQLPPNIQSVTHSNLCKNKINNHQHTIFISWNHQLFTPCTISKSIVCSQSTAIIGELFQSFELPAMRSRFDVRKMFVSWVGPLAYYVESKKYSISGRFWNISPRNVNCSWAQVVTLKVVWWAWRSYIYIESGRYN